MNKRKRWTYDSCDESTYVGSSELSAHGSGSVSVCRHHRLVCRLDLPNPAPWLASGWHLVAAQVQPRFVTRAYKPLPIESKSLGQGVFILLFNLFFFVWLILMPLDAVRFHWSQMPLLLQVIGTVALVGSFILVSLTFRENSFLSPTVRIQEERKQTVISTGPYQYVRHPMYAGGLLLFLGTSLLLGSWYGLLLVLIMIPGLTVRAVLEERVLLNELPGYDSYMAQIKYRLIPYIW
jgi:protein-S-isoprenylcysteine O-methyltransferase Ste14